MKKRVDFRLWALALCLMLVSAYASLAEGPATAVPANPTPPPGPSEALPSDGLEKYRPFTPKAFQEEKKTGDPGMLGNPWPKSAEEAGKTLDILFAHLATTGDHELGRQIAVSIEKIWRIPGGDTVNLLIDRAEGFSQKNENDKALKLLDAAVDLAPDYAEGWNRRAFAHFRLGNNEGALGDLRRTLALEPNHFRALEGMAKVLTGVGEKKGALKAYEELLRVHPTVEGAQTAIDDLKKAVEGQGI